MVLSVLVMSLEPKCEQVERWIKFYIKFPIVLSKQK